MLLDGSSEISQYWRMPVPSEVMESSGAPITSTPPRQSAGHEYSGFPSRAYEDLPWLSQSQRGGESPHTIIYLACSYGRVISSPGPFYSDALQLEFSQMLLSTMLWSETFSTAIENVPPAELRDVRRIRAHVRREYRLPTLPACIDDEDD
jgi:hypothetical protein